MSNPLASTNGREYRVGERNTVLKALTFYLHELESGQMIYKDVFRDVAEAYLIHSPKKSLINF